MQKVIDFFLLNNSADDDDFDADGNPISDNPRNEDSEQSDPSVALQYFLKVGKQYHHHLRCVLNLSLWEPQIPLQA